MFINTWSWMKSLYPAFIRAVRIALINAGYNDFIHDQVLLNHQHASYNSAGDVNGRTHAPLHNRFVSVT
jgi:hypothetical protein